MKTRLVPHMLLRSTAALFALSASAQAHPGHPGHDGVSSAPFDTLPSFSGMEHISLALVVAILALSACRGVFRNLP